ncbi:MAG: replication-associated recombination protein A [Elusimicrobia bacterium]|nr:replication-associated recombination protein A [Elusimicrobiota bacterium]
MNLFSSKEKLKIEFHPLSYLCSPATLDEFFGQEQLLGSGKLLRRLIESDRIFSSIFFGPPGTGKSALARLIALKTQSFFVEMNAVTTGVGELKKIIESAKIRLQTQSQKTILLIDEIHHFNRSQQDALLPDVERGTITLIGITTENPNFYVNSALRSRSRCFEFFPLKENDLEKILDRGLNKMETILKKKIKIEDQAKTLLLERSSGDARILLNALEIGAKSAPFEGDGILCFTLKIAEESLQTRGLAYDKKGDEHYDTISAFIKAMRGGDPDASLYWMAKMLEGGEDPRFIARRILICASEDVGNADPLALTLALSAFQALEFLGMPEARIPLAQAVAYIASAPKSNASTLAIGKALAEVKNGKARQVPAHLKDSNLDKETRGHGKGYLYPHNFPNHWVKQEYMPEPKIFYEPQDQGKEKEIKERLKFWRTHASET